MCVDTSAMLRDLLSHPIIRAEHSHQPLLQDDSLRGRRTLYGLTAALSVRSSVSLAA